MLQTREGLGRLIVPIMRIFKPNDLGHDQCILQSKALIWFPTTVVETSGADQSLFFLPDRIRGSLSPILIYTMF